MKQNTILSAGLVVLVAALTGAGIWVYQTQTAPNLVVVPQNDQEMPEQAQPSGQERAAEEEQNQSAGKITGKDEIANWQTYRNEKYGFEFKYPADFLWQNKIENVVIENCATANFSQTSPCPQSARYSSLKLSLGGNEYWRCRDFEGAAGSRYENYWYVGLANNRCFSFKFTVKHANCGAYGTPDESAYRQCEESSRQKDETVKTIESTFKIFAVGSGAIKPILLSRQYNSGAISKIVWDNDNLAQAHGCYGDQAFDCQITVLRKLGAGDNAVEFYRESDWGVMEDYIAYGNAQDGGYGLIEVFSPWAANSNRQFAFLAGNNLWYLMNTDFEKVIGNYRLKQEFAPDRQVSFSNGVFAGEGKNKNIFTFDITTGCRACGTGYRAVIGYEIDLQNSQVYADLLGFCAENTATDSEYPKCSDKNRILSL
ncbi:MAG: hypothetical protein WA093_02565 [Minisyncoccales bacterium]